MIFIRRQLRREVVTKTEQLKQQPGGMTLFQMSDGTQIRCIVSGQFYALRGKSFQGVFVESHVEHEVELQTRAPFAAKVVRILVQIGELVQKGQVLLYVDAMKMEFAIHAPYRGYVDEIMVQQGEQVHGGMEVIRLRAVDV